MNNPQDFGARGDDRDPFDTSESFGEPPLWADPAEVPVVEASVPGGMPGAVAASQPDWLNDDPETRFGRTEPIPAFGADVPSFLDADLRPDPPVFADEQFQPQVEPALTDPFYRDEPPVAAAPGSKHQQRDPAVRALIEWVPLLLGAFVIAMLVRLFVFQAYSIPSGSMIPTLEINDRVVVNKLSYNFHDVNRGDIVVFKRPADFEGEYDDLIKRVIGLPGEHLSFRSGNVFVDGQLVQESYIETQDSTFPLRSIPGCVPEGTSAECTVPEGHVFVMGDNRRSSQDGRVFGPILEESIVGRAFVKLWPLGELGLM